MEELDFFDSSSHPVPGAQCVLSTHLTREFNFLQMRVLGKEKQDFSKVLTGALVSKDVLFLSMGQLTSIFPMISI